MAGIEKLTALKVARIAKPGKYGDGKGLYLQVTKRLAKSWVFRYERNGAEHFMGLGALHTVGLAEAREEARKARVLLFQGIDPLQTRQAAIAKNKAATANNKTFNECVIEYIASHREAWKNEKHQQQWENTLQTYASPHFGKLYVRQITTPLVLKALEPIWKTKTETASRLRERIERVLSWATTSGYREGENPARWHGHLQELLPKPSRLKKVKHHLSMEYQKIGEFFKVLKTESGLAARALELTILTACRTSEVRNARWEEFDFVKQVWVIPAERMKIAREHRVPLVGASLGLLEKLKSEGSPWVFPGGKEDLPLSNMAMLQLLRRMGCVGVTVHGFRSTFRIWAAEQTDYPKELAELALAHTVGSAVEEAYQRSDLFERRRALMSDWAEWCNTTGNEPTVAFSPDSLAEKRSA